MKILIAGDYRPNISVTDLFSQRKYDVIFDEVKTINQKVDYSIVNLECPVVIGDAKPINKCGPNLRCDENGVEAIKWAGFDCVTLANNHFYDFGEHGVRNTLDCCKSAGLDVVGGGINLQEASMVVYKSIGGQTIAIVNCCEHEFSIATSSHGGANPLNIIQQYHSIKDAKEKADFVIVIVHGGHEHWQLPSPRMVETYRFFIEAGADAVINHHQHCYSGYEIFKEKPIFYGLGNFYYFSSTSSQLWEEGYMVILELDDNIGWRILPYKQCSNCHHVKLLPEDSFNTRFGVLNSIISNNEKLFFETEQYYKKAEKSIKYYFEPVNTFFRSLQVRGLMPSLITKKQLLVISNLLNCESHRDKMLFWTKVEN